MPGRMAYQISSITVVDPARPKLSHYGAIEVASWNLHNTTALQNVRTASGRTTGKPCLDLIHLGIACACGSVRSATHIIFAVVEALDWDGKRRAHGKVGRREGHRGQEHSMSSWRRGDVMATWRYM